MFLIINIMMEFDYFEGFTEICNEFDQFDDFDELDEIEEFGNFDDINIFNNKSIESIIYLDKNINSKQYFSQNIKWL